MKILGGIIIGVALTLAVCAFLNRRSTESRHLCDWTRFALRDGFQSAADLEEVVLLSAALSRLGVDPADTLRHARATVFHGARAPELTAEAERLRGEWEKVEPN